MRAPAVAGRVDIFLVISILGEKFTLGTDGEAVGFWGLVWGSLRGRGRGFVCDFLCIPRITVCLLVFCFFLLLRSGLPFGREGVWQSGEM
jgi:hypothetical protein